MIKMSDAKYCDEQLSMFVGLSVSPFTYPKNTWLNSKKFLCMLPVAVALSSSVVCCYTLCTSGFVDDINFSHNGPTMRHV